jgi:hypothetical protein
MATNEMYRQLLSQAVHRDGSALIGGAMIGGRVNTKGEIRPTAEQKAKRDSKHPPKGPPTVGHEGVKWGKTPVDDQGRKIKGASRPLLRVMITAEEALSRYNSRINSYAANDAALARDVAARLAEINSKLPAGKKHSRLSGEELNALKYKARMGTKRARMNLKKQGRRGDEITVDMLLNPVVRAKAKGVRTAGVPMSAKEKEDRKIARESIAGQSLTEAQRKELLAASYANIASRYGSRKVPQEEKKE